jgi:hypothetical protein
MKDEFRAVFQIDGPSSQFIVINKVEQIRLANINPVDISEPFDSLDLSTNFIEICQRTDDDGTTADLEVYHLKIYITDNRSDFGSKNLNVFNAINSISFTFDSYYETGDTSTIPFGINEIKVDDSGDISKSVIDLYIYGLKEYSYYRLKIKGASDGLKSNDGNYLKEDFLLMLKT